MNYMIKKVVDRYRSYEKCDECGAVQRHIAVSFQGVCPECGFDGISRVIGRWKWTEKRSMFGHVLIVDERFEARE